jgi:hypothetical protein
MGHNGTHMNVEVFSNGVLGPVACPPTAMPARKGLFNGGFKVEQEYVDIGCLEITDRSDI